MANELVIKNGVVVNKSHREALAVTTGDIYSGETFIGELGEACAVGDIVYFDFADTSFKKADNADTSTIPCVAMVVEAGASAANVLLLSKGTVRVSGWTLTAGLLWVSDTAGEFTGTQPTGTGDIVQCIGYAVDATMVSFDPEKTFIELSDGVIDSEALVASEEASEARSIANLSSPIAGSEALVASEEASEARSIALIVDPTAGSEALVASEEASEARSIANIVDPTAGSEALVASEEASEARSEANLNKGRASEATSIAHLAGGTTTSLAVSVAMSEALKASETSSLATSEGFVASELASEAYSFAHLAVEASNISEAHSIGLLGVLEASEASSKATSAANIGSQGLSEALVASEEASEARSIANIVDPTAGSEALVASEEASEARSEANLNKDRASEATSIALLAESLTPTLAENTDVDTGTEDVDTFADTTADGVIWHFLVKNGANLRVGLVYACWDATGDTIQYAESTTQDVGDTSALSLSVDIDSNNVRLRATATSDNWSVKVVRNLI